MDQERFFRTDELQGSLRSVSVRGGAATILGETGRILLYLMATAVLARLLDPADFGLITMVTAVTGFMHRFKDLGLAASTIQKADVRHEQVSALFWINVAFGLLSAVICCGLAPIVAWFYGEPRLTGITLALSVGFLFGGIEVQPLAILKRRLKFGAAALAQVLAYAVGAACGIAAAFAGWGVWSLVVMNLTSAATSCGFIWRAVQWRPSRPAQSKGLRGMLAFGGDITGANLLNYLVRNLDNLLIGWKWGKDALGIYGRAYSLLLFPMQQVNAPLTTIAVPALSRLQNEPERFRSFYCAGIRLLTTCSMPIVVFAITSAESIVLTVMGPKWLGAVPIFRALGPAAFIGSFNVAGGWVLVSLGRARRQLIWTLLGSTLAVLGFFIGLHWGPMGVAVSFSIVSCVTRVPGLYYSFEDTPIRMRDFGAAVARPFVASMAGGAVTFAVNQRALPGVWPPAALCCAAAVYGLSFLAAWLMMPNGRKSLREMVGVVRELRPASHTR